MKRVFRSWLLLIVTMLCLVSICLPLMISHELTSGMSFAEADKELRATYTEDELAKAAPFLHLTSLSASFTSTTEKAFVGAMTGLAIALHGFGIDLPEAMDSRFFTSKNSGVILFRQAHEIPAQVIRKAELPKDEAGSNAREAQ